MNRRILILIGIVLGAAALVVGAVLLWGNTGSTLPDPEETPSGSIVLDDGTILLPEDQVNEPEPDGPRDEDGLLIIDDMHMGEDGEAHLDELSECDQGPYTLPCSEDEMYVMPDNAALAAGSEAAKKFSEAWLTIIPGEDAAARAARLTAAGANATVAAQAPALSRPKTTLSSLTTESVPYGPMYAAFTRVQAGDIVYVVSVTAYATYTIGGAVSQDWSMPGTLLVSVNPATNQVTSIIENFPNLAGMS